MGKNDDFNEKNISDLSVSENISENIPIDNNEEETVNIPTKGIVNVFLDLDNTLISSEPLLNFDLEKYKEKIGLFSQHYMEQLYIVFERPGLQEFLDYLFANFKVSVWTAASEAYALFIINNIILNNKPERKLNWTLFSYHCDWSENRKRGIKGLSLLWDGINIPGLTSDNTLIIDDLNDVTEIQPKNSIKIHPFEFKDEGSENDKDLERVRNILENIKA